MVKKRTLVEWFSYLDDPKRQFTRGEFQAVMAMNAREYARLTLELTRTMAQAAEHTEGMVGALDQFAAGLAERSGLPYATSATLRAALDAARDAQRTLAAAETRP